MADPVHVIQLRRQFENAHAVLSDRCLYESAKWAAEALNGLPDLSNGEDDDDDGSGDEDMQSTEETFVSTSMESRAMPSRERSKYVLAKSCFDCHEYDRAANLLVKCKSPKAMFLRLYAQYISGEKKKEEQSEVILGPLDGDATPNKQLVDIIAELEEYFTSVADKTALDPFLLYIYGIVLVRHKCHKQAVQPLIRSVRLFPFNWGAWLELAACVSSVEHMPIVLAQVPRNHIMTRMFEVFCSQELFQATDAVFATLANLELVLPDMMFLKIQRAMLCYHGLEYAEAEQLFDMVLNADPHRLDDMDIYSNILYVTEQRAKLAFVAQLASATDKFRPETCCIVANYYSLKSEHEKAVVYYRRALTLNRDCLGAWTLMGHEYVELKNIRAAIESYRRAISVNSKDVRAWYGLGQAYEVIEMYHYSFFYYQRAAALKPYDHRMWVALGSCFEKLQRPAAAIKAYKRALSLSEMDPSVLAKLVAIYTSIGETAMVEEYTQLQKAAENLQLQSEQI